MIFGPKKSVAFTLYVVLVDSAAQPAFKSNPTIVAGDFQISKDGGAFENLATLPTVTPAGGVQVKVELSAAEMNADNITVKAQDQAGAEWDDNAWTIATQANEVKDVYDAVAALNDPAASAIADAVMDEALSGHTTSGTAGAALGRIGTGQITTVSPVAQSGDLILIADNDYSVAGGNPILWTKTEGEWPDFTGATITFHAGSFNKPCEDVTQSQVRLELTAAQTAALSNVEFTVKAVFASGEKVDLVRGDLIVWERRDSG